jgi:hypothetical protein
VKQGGFGGLPGSDGYGRLPVQQLNLNPAVKAGRKPHRPSAAAGSGKSDYHLKGDLRSGWNLMAANAGRAEAAEPPFLG